MTPGIRNAESATEPAPVRPRVGSRTRPRVGSRVRWRTRLASASCPIAAPLLLLFAAGCAGPTIGESEDALAEFLLHAEEIGYSVTLPLAEVDAEEWALEHANHPTTSLRRARLKSNFPVEIGTSLYYRFEIDELTAPDYAAAHARAKEIEEQPEGAGNDDEQGFALQRGFAQGTRVIRIRSDVRRFAPALDAMTTDVASFLRAGPELRASTLASIRARISKDLNLRMVQNALAEAGLYRGPIDGIIGRGSRRAISEFRERNGLAGGPTIDEPLLAALEVPADPIAYFNQRVRSAGTVVPWRP